jgi:AraC family transcriptional regulator
MSLTAPEMFGSDRDGNPQADYCCYCLRDGSFTQDMSMAEKMEHFIRFLDTMEKEEGCALMKNELALRMRVRLPVLRRWQSHEITHRKYFKAMNTAVKFINEHLHETMNLHRLAETVHISGFHFHRIFKAMLGECPGRYIQRLRMEKAAFKLTATNRTLMEIAEQTGYQSPQSLSKAFRKYYGIVPSEFRRLPQDAGVHVGRTERMFVTPDIREVEPKTVISTCVTDPFRSPDACRDAWQKLVRFMQVDDTPDATYEYICLTQHLSTVTKSEHCGLHVGIVCTGNRESCGVFERRTIAGGLYAVFPFRGTCENMEMLYCYIYRNWLPNHPYELREVASFEKFLHTPVGMNADEFVAEVYIPIVLSELKMES